MDTLLSKKPLLQNIFALTQKHSKLQEKILQETFTPRSIFLNHHTVEKYCIETYTKLFAVAFFKKQFDNFLKPFP